jgi:hypothetical protein
LTGIRGDCEICDERIFSLAGAVRDDRRAPVGLRERDASRAFRLACRSD